MNEIERQEELNDQLWNSCEEGDVESARKLIKDGASVENDLLHIAAGKGNLGLVKLLVEHGADICYEGFDQNTEYIPIFEAIKNGHVDVVNFLREYHRKINKPAINRWGQTPLSVAIYETKLDLAKSFLEEGDNPNGAISDKSYWNVPLHLAAEIGDLQAVELLLEYGADIDIKYALGSELNTALYRACEEKKLEIAKFFLDKGANPNIENENGRTPLHVASEKGSIELVDLLLRNRANPDIKDKNGITPLHIASEKESIELVDLLLQNGANPNIKDEKGSTPLHIVSEKGNIELVNLFLHNRADTNIKDKNGDTCLHIASRFGHTNLVQPMLLKGSNIDIKNNNQNTPLYTALQQIKTETAKLLLKFGANPNVVNLDDKTPLNVAIRTRNLEAVNTLLESGADINIANNRGLLPLSLAISYSDIISQSLIRHITKLEVAGLPVDEKNLQLHNQSTNYPQNLQEYKKEIEKITKENKSLINFLKAENSEESEEIWVENENVRNAFDNPKLLKEQYPEYANILINKANEVKKKILLDNIANSNKVYLNLEK